MKNYDRKTKILSNHVSNGTRYLRQLKENMANHAAAAGLRFATPLRHAIIEQIMEIPLMKSKWVSRFLLVSGGVVTGVIIGLLISYQYQRTAFKTAYELVTIGFKAWEGVEAMEAYKNDQPETAQYALHHNAKVLEFFYNNKDKDGFPEGTAQDLAITYIRLGKVAQSEGKQKIAEDYFNKGFSVYQKYKQSIGKEKSWFL